MRHTLKLIFIACVFLTALGPPGEDELSLFLLVAITSACYYVWLTGRRD